MKFLECQSNTQFFIVFGTLFSPRFGTLFVAFAMVRPQKNQKGPSQPSPPRRKRPRDAQPPTPSSATPPVNRRARLVPSLARSPLAVDLRSPATPRRQPENVDSLETQFQQCLDGLEPSLASAAPVFSLLFMTLLKTLRAQPALPQTPGAEAKAHGRHLRAHARESLGSVVQAGIVVKNRKKHSKFAKAVRTVKKVAWQRNCVDGWLADNNVDASLNEMLHGVMRSYSNNIDQTAGDRYFFARRGYANQRCACV